MKYFSDADMDRVIRTLKSNESPGNGEAVLIIEYLRGQVLDLDSLHWNIVYGEDY